MGANELACGFVRMALKQGWRVEKGPLGDEVLLPPADHVALGWCAEWHEIDFGGKPLCVPDYMPRVMCEVVQ